MCRFIPMKVNIGTAAKHFGVSQETLRRWEKSGKIPVERTPKGHRRFDLSRFSPTLSKKLGIKKHTLGYARVSSHDQKEDLLRQAQVLENFCATNGWAHETAAKHFGVSQETLRRWEK